jgi:hypothetical protein
LAPDPISAPEPDGPSLTRTYALALILGALWIGLLWWLTAAFNQPTLPR